MAFARQIQGDVHEGLNRSVDSTQVFQYFLRATCRSEFEMQDIPQALRQWTLLRSLGARRQGMTLRDLAAEYGGLSKDKS